MDEYITLDNVDIGILMRSLNKTLVSIQGV